MTDTPTRRSRRLESTPIRELPLSGAALERLSGEGIRVSARLSDLGTGNSLLRSDDYAELPVGSLGQLLLLIEASARMTLGPVPELTRTPEDVAEGAGLWQHLVADTLAMEDVATLVASHNDRLAANVLLREIGLAAIAERASSLGLRSTALLDGVSARADQEGRARQSVSTMTEFSELLWRLHGNSIVDPETSGRVLSWLWQNADPGYLFGVAGLDPLSQPTGQDVRGTVLVSREYGVHAEAGVIEGPAGGVCFSIVVCFSGEESTVRLRIQEALATIGAEVLGLLSGSAPRSRRGAHGESAGGSPETLSSPQADAASLPAPVAAAMPQVIEAPARATRSRRSRR